MLEHVFNVTSRVGIVVILIAIMPLLVPTVSSGLPSETVAAPTDIETVTPAPTPLEPKVATPTPAPVESATSTPEPAVPPQSLPATLTIPNAGISEMPIIQFDAQRDLQTVVSYDSNGNPSAPFLVLEPPEMNAIVWYNADPGSTLTSQSSATAPLYCHANTEANPGVCQYLFKLKAGDTLVIENSSERLTYQATTDPKPVPKKDAANDPEFTIDAPNTIQVITCDREGASGVDHTGHSRDNLFLVFELVSVTSR